LKGPIIELEDLSLDEVIVTLDLSTLGAGTHLVEPRITPPNSLRAESVIPEQIEVTIIEQRGVRDLLLPVTVVGLSPNQVAAIEPLSVTVGVEGPLLALETLDLSLLQLTLQADSLTEGSYFLTPTLVLSDRISVTSMIPAQVSLKVFSESRLLVLTAPVQMLNLGSGLQATLSSDVAIVRVAGPGSATTLSRDPAFGISLDLTGRSEGTYIVEPVIRLPAGYTLVSAVPRQLEVRLTRRSP
ncbi:MAG: hypothetical protein H0T73_14825, partial [Ardenticatenales bacterium]|nr:hypothetical protein [Ardenticatenales bacterium]